MQTTFTRDEQYAAPDRVAFALGEPHYSVIDVDRRTDLWRSPSGGVLVVQSQRAAIGAFVETGALYIPAPTAKQITLLLGAPLDAFDFCGVEILDG